MRVLFVNPFFLNESALERRWMTPYPPLGLLYLAAAVRRAGHEVDLFDGTFAESRDRFDDALRAGRPDVVCFTSLVTLRPAILDLAGRALASRRVVGGPDATVYPEAYSSVADMVVLGEGEETLVEWLGAQARGGTGEGLAGTVQRYPAGEIVRTELRPPIADLDRLPVPALNLVDVARYFDVWQAAHGYTSLPVAASRGCPFSCEHCAQSATGPHWRVRSPASVAAEMRAWEEVYGPDRFRLVDDLDGLGRDWLSDLASAMAAAGVTTPYEGVRAHDGLRGLPMFEPRKALCADRNEWIPKVSGHPHAPPVIDVDEIQRRWSRAVRVGPDVC